MYWCKKMTNMRYAAMKNGLRFKWKSNSSRSLESRFEFELFTSERNLLQDWNTPTSTQPAPSSTPEERNYYLKYMIIIITKTSRRDGVGIWWKNKFVEKTKLNFLETQYWCLESPTEKQQMFFFKLALPTKPLPKILISDKQEFSALQNYKLRKQDFEEHCQMKQR